MLTFSLGGPAVYVYVSYRLFQLSLVLRSLSFQIPWLSNAYAGGSLIGILYMLTSPLGCPAVYVYVSYRLFQLTLVFKNVVVPHGDRATTTEVKQLTRNFILVAISVALLWALGYVCLLALGMAHVIQPLSPAVPAT